MAEEEMSSAPEAELGGGLPLHADLMLEAAPPPPFDWVREGTSLWLFEENGAFGIPRIGVEAEPWTWDNRRYAANFAFADGRVLQSAGVGPAAPVMDAQGRPMVMGGGPMTFRCIEPFRRWAVSFQGEMVDTHVSNQIVNTVDPARRTPLRYEIELTMAAPANVQDISPEKFAKWGKGKQRDAVSVGLGWRFEQVLRGEGELEVDGQRRTFKAVGSRVKRRSVRTDGLMLRGHSWQTVVFPDGRACGYEARPVHDEGFEPWNEGFIWQDGRMHHARVVDPPWLNEIVPHGEDVSFTLESDLGLTRIRGTTELNTFRVATKDLWGLNLHQGGVRYVWDDQVAYGMIERSMPPGKVVPR
jgi:prepilin-type processing-associated H-X9-DG protein